MGNASARCKVYTFILSDLFSFFFCNFGLLVVVPSFSCRSLFLEPFFGNSNAHHFLFGREKTKLRKMLEKNTD